MKKSNINTQGLLWNYTCIVTGNKEEEKKSLLRRVMKNRKVSIHLMTFKAQPYLDNQIISTIAGTLKKTPGYLVVKKGKEKTEHYFCKKLFRFYQNLLAFVQRYSLSSSRKVFFNNKEMTILESLNQDYLVGQTVILEKISIIRSYPGDDKKVHVI
jgi:hypothetical protein